MSLFYSNPLGGWAGFFAVPCKSVDAVTRLNCLIFVDFCRQLFAHFPLPTLAHFLNVVYFFNMIWIFLWHINVFNVRQSFCKQDMKFLIEMSKKEACLHNWLQQRSISGNAQCTHTLFIINNKTYLSDYLKIPVLHIYVNINKPV